MKNTHLSLNDRITIQVGIKNNSKFIDICKNIGKDPTTISKEIKLHREIHQRNIEKALILRPMKESKLQI